MNLSLRHVFCLFLALSGSVGLSGCSTNVLLAGGATYGALYYEENMVFQVYEDLLAPGKFQITVDKGRLIGGRDGELWTLFKRKANEIAEREGCNGYQLLEYNESIESAVIAGKRVGRGIIECNKTASAKG